MSGMTIAVSVLTAALSLWPVFDLEAAHDWFTSPHATRERRRRVSIAFAGAFIAAVGIWSTAVSGRSLHGAVYWISIVASVVTFLVCRITTSEYCRQRIDD